MINFIKKLLGVKVKPYNKYKGWEIECVPEHSFNSAKYYPKYKGKYLYKHLGEIEFDTDRRGCLCASSEQKAFEIIEKYIAVKENSRSIKL